MSFTYPLSSLLYKRLQELKEEPAHILQNGSFPIDASSLDLYVYVGYELSSKKPPRKIARGFTDLNNGDFFIYETPIQQDESAEEWSAQLGKNELPLLGRHGFGKYKEDKQVISEYGQAKQLVTVYFSLEANADVLFGALSESTLLLARSRKVSHAAASRQKMMRKFLK